MPGDSSLLKRTLDDLTKDNLWAYILESSPGGSNFRKARQEIGEDFFSYTKSYLKANCALGADALAGVTVTYFVPSLGASGVVAGMAVSDLAIANVLEFRKGFFSEESWDDAIKAGDAYGMPDDLEYVSDSGLIDGALDRAFYGLGEVFRYGRKLRE